MSRRYRFLTNPRIFRVFTERKINLVEFFLCFFLTFTIGLVLFQYFDWKRDKAREEALITRFSQDLADARAEIRVLKAGETKRDGTPRSTPALLKGASETAPTAASPRPDDKVDTMSGDTVEVVQTGPFKGLPLDVAKEIHEEYTAASLARAKRYHEWDLRRMDHKERDIALAKRELAHGDAVLADSKKRRENLLAFFALMSPEALKAARKEALKTQAAEEVDSFFRQVAEFGPVKSAEEINQTAQALAENHKALNLAWQELEAEREQITREWEELQRTKPLPPNLGLDEFYTEWKNVIAQSPPHHKGF